MKNDDDDDEFIVKAVEEPKVELSEDGKHGGLVQKILQTKRQLEGTQNDQKSTTMAKPVDAKEISVLREAIQLLCQSTNPLGKTMDYLQEDVDSMNKELEIWKRESSNFKFQAQEQEKITADTLKPLRERLSQIELSIEDQVKKIAALKSDILQVF